MKMWCQWSRLVRQNQTRTISLTGEKRRVITALTQLDDIKIQIIVLPSVGVSYSRVCEPVCACAVLRPALLCISPSVLTWFATNCLSSVFADPWTGRRLEVPLDLSLNFFLPPSSLRSILNHSVQHVNWNDPPLFTCIISAHNFTTIWELTWPATVNQTFARRYLSSSQ